MRRELPTKKDYEGFVREFSGALSREHPNVCFYVYGSFANGTCNYGRSDIDGGLVLDSGVVTPKIDISSIGEILAEITIRRGIKTQFNLTDRASNRDGRFLSYTSDYTDWIKQSGKIICGDDLVSEMNGLNFKSGVLYSSAFNFRKVRNNVLYASYYLQADREEFRKAAEGGLKTLCGFPKKLVWLRGEEIIASRQAARNRLAEILEGINLEAVDRANRLLDNPEQLYAEIERDDRALELMLGSLEGIELMISDYLRQFPEFSDREIKF